MKTEVTVILKNIKYDIVYDKVNNAYVILYPDKQGKPTVAADGFDSVADAFKCIGEWL